MRKDCKPADAGLNSSYYILGLISELYRDNGKEIGNYHVEFVVNGDV